MYVSPEIVASFDSAELIGDAHGFQEIAQGSQDINKDDELKDGE
ncbi:MAG: hypothetical protein NVS3B28_11490 [Candidatus Velthaea sp.]